MKNQLISFAGLAMLTLASWASAHHGFAAHFDPSRLIRIEGTIKQFDFINPHGLLYIDSVDDAGKPIVYVCDLQARTQLARRGVDQTLFTVGEPIIVEGFPARRDPYGCEFGTGYFANGSSYTMRSTDEARTQFAENQEIPFTPGTNRSIFGTWIRPGMFGDASGSGQLHRLARRRKMNLIPLQIILSFTPRQEVLYEVGAHQVLQRPSTR